MTARLLLLLPLVLTACADPAHPVELGVTNATTFRMTAVTFSVGPDTLGAVGPVEPETSTTWGQGAFAPPSAATPYTVDVAFSSGRTDTISLGTVGAETGPADWIHVRVNADSIFVETSAGTSVAELRDIPPGLAPAVSTPADSTSQPADSSATL